MINALRSGWNWLPIFVRAIVMGLVVFEIGSDLTAIPLFGNLKFHPEIPWALPVALLLLGLYWAYFSGWGPPNSTRDARRTASRKGLVSASLWLAALPAAASGTLMLILLRLVAPYVMPVAAPAVKIQLSSYPPATVIGLLLSIAVIAAVTEELAYRGYMQKTMEDRYGVVPAILVSGIMFWIAHLPDVTITHLPGHLAASAVFGLLAYLTRSLWPAIAAHAVADLILQPAYLYHAPQFAWTALSARPLWEGGAPTTLDQKLEAIWTAMKPENLLASDSRQLFAILSWLFVLSVAATVFSFLGLARESRRERRSAVDDVRVPRRPAHPSADGRA